MLFIYVSFIDQKQYFKYHNSTIVKLLHWKLSLNFAYDYKDIIYEVCIWRDLYQITVFFDESGTTCPELLWHTGKDFIVVWHITTHVTSNR